MPSREHAVPVAMERVAVVAPAACLRDALVQVAAAGVVEVEQLVPGADAPVSEATRRLQRMGTAAPCEDRAVRRSLPDLDLLEAEGRADLLAGEAEVEDRCAAAVVRGPVAAVVGWTPREALPALAEILELVGAAAVPLPRPAGVQPPTQLRSEGVTGAFTPIVRTYATVPYDDIDPTLLAGLAYIVMFAMMFGDLGHGLLLLAAGLVLRTGRPRRFARAKGSWPFVAAAGAASAAVGVGYGECFGPTGLVPWRLIDPLDQPVPLLLTAVGLGAVLLAVSYVVGTVNRVREGGWLYALYAPAGVAGATLFFGAGLVVWGLGPGAGQLVSAGAVLAAAGLGLSFVGLHTGAERGAAGMAQTVVELFDLVLRLGSNVVSFARLAAFGMAHAALAGLVWQGTTRQWSLGGLWLLSAAVVFAVGNAVAFALEGLVAGIQALRLEYYELFSRVFQDEGRPFIPWQLRVEDIPRVEEAVA